MVDKVNGSRTESLQKLPDVCRICLSTSSEENTHEELYCIEDIYVPRSGLTEHITSFRDILTIFVNDEINTHGAMLPNIICITCAQRAQEAYKFMEQCRRTDHLLESHFQTLKTNDENNTQSGVLSEVVRPIEERVLQPKEPTPQSFEQQTQAAGILSSKDGGSNLDLKAQKKRFHCNKCQKSFVQPQTLRRHYLSHDNTGSSLKKCTFCGKTFLRADGLTRHVRIHTGERPYKCKVCPKAFKQWSEVNEHSMTHTTDKLYKCSECSKELSTRNGLYVHMKLHRREKRSVCLHCDKRFTTPSELVSHMRRIHTQK